MIRVGSIVTITVDNPDGLEEMHMNGTVGIVSEYYEGSDTYDPSWRIDTDSTEGFLFGKEQFREATKEEMENRLRELLMK